MIGAVMSKNENEDSATHTTDAQYASKVWDVLASVGIAVGTGIPLPPSIIKSLRKTADKFIHGATEYGMTFIEEATAKRKSIVIGKQLVLNTAAEAVAKKVTNDNNLMERAFDIFATDLIVKQQNKEKVLEIAVGELSNTKSFDISEDIIDDDWLGTFSTLASEKSNADVQQLLGKILAGEIRTPGSFSPLTLHILSTLTPRIAQSFEAVCNLSTLWNPDEPNNVAFVLNQPYPNYLHQGLPEYGVSYGDILILQNYGLLTQKLDAGLALREPVLEAIVDIGGTQVKLKSNTGIPIYVSLQPLSPLSISGSELRQIISLKVPAEHLKQQIKYFNSIGFDATT
jgi:hypothetical protein